MHRGRICTRSGSERSSRLRNKETRFNWNVAWRSSSKSNYKADHEVVTKTAKRERGATGRQVVR